MESENKFIELELRAEIAPDSVAAVLNGLKSAAVLLFKIFPVRFSP